MASGRPGRDTDSLAASTDSAPATSASWMTMAIRPVARGRRTPVSCSDSDDRSTSPTASTETPKAATRTRRAADPGLPRDRERQARHQPPAHEDERQPHSGDQADRHGECEHRDRLGEAQSPHPASGQSPQRREGELGQTELRGRHEQPQEQGQRDQDEGEDCRCDRGPGDLLLLPGLGGDRRQVVDRVTDEGAACDRFGWALQPRGGGHRLIQVLGGGVGGTSRRRSTNTSQSRRRQLVERFRRHDEWRRLVRRHLEGDVIEGPRHARQPLAVEPEVGLALGQTIGADHRLRPGRSEVGLGHRSAAP